MDSLMTFYGQFSCKLSGYAICDSLVARGINFTADQAGIQRCAAQAAIVLIARPLFPPFHSTTTASAKTSVIQDVDRSNDFSPKTINMLINQIIHQVIALYISG